MENDFEFNEYLKMAEETFAEGIAENVILPSNGSKHVFLFSMPFPDGDPNVINIDIALNCSINALISIFYEKGYEVVDITNAIYDYNGIFRRTKVMELKIIYV